MAKSSNTIFERFLPRFLTRFIWPWDALGLRPFRRSIPQCWRAIRGDSYSPGARYGLSSLRMLHPLRGPATWLGLAPRRTWVLNYVNRDGAPADMRKGFDVRSTNATDFLGGGESYNTHFGTDFVIPVGTKIAAPAPGRVVRVENLMQRGGLKVILDHGEGLMTLYNHLARATVTKGDTVCRGDLLGFSGMSGVDGVLFFPWLPPHLHFTVLLNGDAVDPFALPGETSMWRHGNNPLPIDDTGKLPRDEQFEFNTAWSDIGIRTMLSHCKDESLREEISATSTLPEKGHLAVYARMFFYNAFDEHPPLVQEDYPRRSVLDLPFLASEVTGVQHRGTLKDDTGAKLPDRRAVG